MSNKSQVEGVQKFMAYLAMKADEDAATKGEVSTDHLDALLDAPIGRSEEVRKAHAEGRGPPDFSNAGGRGKGRGPPDFSNAGGRGKARGQGGSR